MRISKIKLASGIAAAAMLSVAAGNASAEDVTISTATTTPLTTSDPNPAAPVAAGDITVASGGSITVSAGQTAITVDSSNDVSNSGQISSTDADNTTGILLLGGNSGTITNSSAITLLESYTATDGDTDGDADGPFATGTNRHGIYLQGGGGAFTGDILSPGQIGVEGNNSSAIRLDALLDGNINTSGNITVTGDDSVGVAINGGAAGGVTGDVIMRGGMSVRGENSSGLIVDAEIGGSLMINGGWTVSGFRYTTRPPDVSPLDADDLLNGGPAIAVHYSVAGGIVIEGIGVEDDQDDDDDGVTEADGDTNDDATASIFSYGNGPALLIEADPSANLVVGAASTGFGLHVQGAITGAGVYDGFDGTAIRIQGSGGSTVQIADGIAIDGAVAATAADGDAYALVIGADANVSEVLVRRNLSAFIVTDNAARTAHGLLIEAGATMPELTNSGSMRTQVFGEGGTAATIRDASNTLATITNSGSITAEIYQTDADLTDNLPPPPITGETIAIDVSASTIDVTLNQIADVPYNDEDAFDDDFENRPATAIRGDILFGAGNDTINLLAGDIIGDIAFGAGVDTFLIDGGNFAGRITDDGTLAIDVQDGTLAHLGGTTNIATANFAADGDLGVFLSETPGESSFIHASGQVTFAAGSEIIPIVPTGLPVSGSHIFLTADGGLVGAANVTGVVDSAGAPFLYTLTIGEVLGDPNSLEAAYLMKTTTQLGLNENETRAFDPIIAALRQDDAAAAAFSALASQADFASAYDDLMPSYAAASTELAATAIQQMQSATTNRMAHTRLQGLDEVSAWVQEIAYGLHREPATANGQEFRGNGFGMALGIDGPLDNGALFGLSASFLATEAEEPHRPEGEISSWFGQANAYLGTAMGPVDLDFVLGGGFGQMRERRFVEIGTTYSARTEAEWWAYEGHGAARASVPLQMGDWFVVTPQAALTYVALAEEGYTEEGGGPAIDLEADDMLSQRLWADAGVEFSARWRVRGGGVVAPRIYAGYRANVIDDGGERTFRFVSGGSDFTLTDEALGDGGPLVGIGIDATNGWSTLALGYEGEFGDQIERHSINASLRFRF